MTKEDFLKQIIENKGSCDFVPCNCSCPYYNDTLIGCCKFASERTRVIIAKILLRSFPTQESEIERLKQQVQNLTLMLEQERKVRVNTESLQEICKLENQIEKMKCCGNCKHLKYYEQALDKYECDIYDVSDINGVCDCEEWGLKE